MRKALFGGLFFCTTLNHNPSCKIQAPSTYPSNIMQTAIIETTGSFGLTDPNNLVEVHFDKPTCAPITGFISQRIALGQVRVLEGNLPEGANDTEFQRYLSESNGNLDLAIDAYLASFKPVETKKGAK